MPKIKTSRSAAKRFSTTGSGKFRRRRQNLRHILTKKDAKRRAKRAAKEAAKLAKANGNAAAVANEVVSQ